MLSIAIDIGGTRIKTGLSRGDKIIANSILDVTDSASLSGELPRIESAIQEILSRYFNGTIFETPAINLVFFQPRELPGERVYARFGAEFPIRPYGESEGKTCATIKAYIRI